MIVANIIFVGCEQKSLDSVSEIIDNFLHSLRHLGRIIYLRNTVYQKNSNIVAQCVLPEKNSLNEMDCNKWFIQLAKEKIFITTEILGNELYNDLCTCGSSNGYILSNDIAAPLHCLTCNGAIPLYRIQPTYLNESYYNLNCWTEEGDAWNKIEFYSHLEKEAQTQLCDISSQFNIKGLALREIIEQLTKKKCYYYLRELRYPEDINYDLSVCPNCQHQWVVSENFLDSYEKKCDRCNLLFDRIL